MLNVIMRNVIMMNAMMLNVIMLDVIMLNVNMLMALRLASWALIRPFYSSLLYYLINYSSKEFNITGP